MLELLEAVEREARARDITHGALDTEHPYAIDPLPRIVDADAWSTLSRGVEQRVRALDTFVADAHGAQRAVRDGVVPADLLRAPWLVEAMRAAPPPAAWCVVAGPDVVVDAATGEWLVLEDNVRTPTMAGYACAAAELVRPLRPPEAAVADPAAELPRALLRALRATAPDADEPHVVVLGDGARSGVRWELHDLARRLGLPLVEPHELRVVRDELRTRADDRRVDVVWRRTSEEHLHLPDGAASELHDLFARPVATGRVRVANAFGTGVADDKRAFAYVPDLVRWACGEEPLLRQPRTYDLAEAAQLAEAKDRLDELVVKPRAGSGGGGVLIGPAATAQELDAAREQLDGDWIAQEPVALSTEPAVAADGTIDQRHVDLRPFVCWDGCGWTTPRAGYTRVAARPGELIVNSSRGGGGKDTWVLSGGRGAAAPRSPRP